MKPALAVRLFDVPGAVAHDPAIDVWLTSRSEPFPELARRWFEEMRACGGDVREIMHDGAPTACVQYAAFAYVNVYKAHMNVGFFNGAVLDDPAGLLEGSGKLMRHVKLRPGSEVNSPALARLIRASYSDMKARLK